MKLRIEIDCDNAAFEPDPDIECKRILTDLQTRLSNNYFLVGQSFTLHDVNGNKVGTAEITN